MVVFINRKNNTLPKPDFKKINSTRIKLDKTLAISSIRFHYGKYSEEFKKNKSIYTNYNQV